MISPSKITDVIFDLDGTLIDSAPSILACFARTLAANGIEPALPLTSDLIGPPLHETLYRLSGVDDDAQLAGMIRGFKQHYDLGGYKETVIFPGVHAMLRKLHGVGLRLHIATNKRLRPTELILAHFGWNIFFSAIYASDSRTPPFTGKDEMLSELLRDERIAPSAAVYIGDRHDDRVAAEANDLGFIAAAWGYRDEVMIATKPPLCAIVADDICRLLVLPAGAAARPCAST